MMNEFLKAKYYGLVENKDYAHYGMVCNALAALENKMILSNNIGAIQDFISTIEPLQNEEKEVYNEIKKDLEGGLIEGSDNNEAI